MSLARDVLSTFVLTRRFFKPKPVPYKPIPIPEGKGVHTESDITKKIREDEPLRRKQVEEAALHQLLRDAQAHQASQEAPESGTTQPLEGTAAVTAEGVKPTLSERRTAALDKTRLEGSAANLAREVQGSSSQKAAEGRATVRVGADDSETKG